MMIIKKFIFLCALFGISYCRLLPLGDSISETLATFTGDQQLKESRQNAGFLKAVNSGETEVAKMLLASGANIWATTEYGSTALHIVAETGDIVTAKFLIDKEPLLVRSLDYEDATPLHEAALHGRIDIARLLIENGANVTQPDFFGATPLHCAALTGDASIINLLLTKGADINATDNYGGSALHAACFRGLVNAVRSLLTAKIDLDIKDRRGFTALHNAAYYGHAFALKQILAAGGNRYIVDNEGMTPKDVICLCSASFACSNICINPTLRESIANSLEMEVA